jgi:hypothetical protein
MLSSKVLQRAAFTKVSFQTTTTKSLSTLSLPFNRSTSVSNTRAMMRGFTSSSSLLDMPSAPTSIHPHVQKPNASGSLIYTETDEAPALATFSLLPILTKVSYDHADDDE